MDFKIKDGRVAVIFETAGTLTAAAMEMKQAIKVRPIEDKALAAFKIAAAEMQETINNQLIPPEPSPEINILV